MAERFRIASIRAREIIDCRGFPTIQTDVHTGGGSLGRADVACGRSTGRFEAKELRDGGSRFLGRGVQRAIRNIHEIIAPALLDRDVRHQREIDRLLSEGLDPSGDKSGLGANATTSVSLAVARASAAAQGRPLWESVNPRGHVIPMPMINLIGGGKLGASGLEIQEFHVVPLGASSLLEALQMATEINGALARILGSRYGSAALHVGDEGGFMPDMRGLAEPLACLAEAVEDAGYTGQIAYSMDCAASHFYDADADAYRLGGDLLTTDEMLGLYEQVCADFPVVSIEDPLQQEDWDGYRQLGQRLDVQVVGDDLFVTHPQRLLQGVHAGAANALLWKVNQIGTLTEALDTAFLAYDNGFCVQVSERSGETEDPLIADLAVALNCGQIKTGAPVRGERTSKYNRLLQIEEELGARARFPGRWFRQWLDSPPTPSDEGEARGAD